MNLNWKIGDAFLDSKGQTFIIREIESDDVHGGVYYLSSPVQDDTLYVFNSEEMLSLLDKACELPDLMFAVSCEKCDSAECCERTDLPDEPILCDECYNKVRKIRKMELFSFTYERPNLDKPLKTGRKSSSQFAMIDTGMQARVEAGYKE